MRFFMYFRNPETRPPTEIELREDRNESFAMVLREYGLDKIRLKTKWHDNQNGALGRAAAVLPLALQRICAKAM